MLSQDQIISLKKILNLACEIESNWNQPKKAAKIQNLCFELKKLETENHEILKKISKYHSHITENLSARQLMNFIVPIERLLGQSSVDHDFLVSTEDQLHKTLERIPLEIYLDHFRSAFNVGSVFRTADALGVQKIHLGGYTATPQQDVVRKTALGSEIQMPWEHHEKSSEALKKLKSEGYRLIAFETSAKAKSLESPFEKTKSLFIFGNERFGLDPEILNLCDELRQISMSGYKNSLNASVCMAIATYEWKRQWTST